MNIGFIGLGAMGRPMALHLCRAGYDVSVYARRPGVAAPLVAAGATLFATPAELASASDVVVTMVMATVDVEEVLLGDHGVLIGARQGSVVIDMSTIAPQATRRIATALQQRHVRMLDAPVTGGSAGAEAATLTIMVGGDAAVLDEVRPVLERLGRQIVHMGGHGAGQVAKACNQLALLVNAEGVAEAGARRGRWPRTLGRGVMAWIRARSARRYSAGSPRAGSSTCSGAAWLSASSSQGLRRGSTTRTSRSSSISLGRLVERCRRPASCASISTR